MNQLNLTEAKKKRPSKDLSTEEKKEILNYLKANPKDKKAVPFLMEKYNVSNITIGILIIQEKI
jgi:hypothetical protein